MRELSLQSLVGSIPISIIGILGKNGLNEGIERIGSLRLPGNTISSFQKMADLFHLYFQSL
jgi:hypothetical protein